MKFNRIIAIFFAAFLMLSFTSCEFLDSLDDPDDPVVEHTATSEMSGEWWVRYLADDGSGNLVDIYNWGYTKILTSNTAENVETKMWVTDVLEHGYNGAGNFWYYRVEADVNPSTKSFHATDAENRVYTSENYENSQYDILVNIANGKVIKDGGTSKDGNPTDSIYFEIIFEDDPTTTYYVSGHKRTGFLEDDFH